MSATLHCAAGPASIGQAATDAILRRTVDDAGAAMGAGIDALTWVHHLSQTIADLARESREGDPVRRLRNERRIEVLAQLCAHLADDFANTLDGARGQLTQEDLPKMLAAVGGAR